MHRKAKRVLQIFCPGGASHLDTFDYKPGLEKRNGQPMPGGDPWKFVGRG